MDKPVKVIKNLVLLILSLIYLLDIQVYISSKQVGNKVLEFEKSMLEILHLAVVR